VTGQTHRWQVPSDPTIVERIKERSRLLARRRHEVETIVTQRYATVLSCDGARAGGALRDWVASQLD
jgi:hypothetical protein